VTQNQWPYKGLDRLHKTDLQKLFTSLLTFEDRG